MTQPDLRSDETKYNDDRVHRAVAVERERCAKIADGFARANVNFNPNLDEATIASSVARAIANQIRQPRAARNRAAHHGTED